MQDVNDSYPIWYKPIERPQRHKCLGAKSVGMNIPRDISIGNHDPPAAKVMKLKNKKNP